MAQPDGTHGEALLPNPSLQDTPHRRKASTAYASDSNNHNEKSDTNRDLWQDEIRGKVCAFAEPETVNSFLDRFLPCSVPPPQFTIPAGIFSDVPQTTADGGNAVEADMYAPLVAGLNALCNNLPASRRLNFMAFGDAGPYWQTIHKEASLHRTRPDIAATRPGVDWNADADQRREELRWDNVSMTVEAKQGNTQDPIDGTTGRLVGKGGVLLRQVCKNARNMLLANGSCFVFVIAVFGKRARIFRVDRAGAVASEAFEYEANPDVIASFLWRLVNRTNGAIYGDDPTVTRPSEAEKDLLRAALISHHGYSGLTLKQLVASSRKMTIPLVPLQNPPQHNASAPAGTSIPVLGEQQANTPTTSSSNTASASREPSARHYYTIGDPRDYTTNLFSRGTFVWDAIELVEPRTICVVKDSWRQDGRTAESDFYVQLQGSGEDSLSATFGLPEYGCGADLDAMGYPLQRTDTARVIDPQNAERVHMRITMKTVGVPLDDFTTSRQLVEAVRDAIIGHRNALDKGILHRDVSLGNVMIAPSEHMSKGFICDFDYSVEYPRTPSQDSFKNKERTGTYFFMSQDILRDDPPPLHDARHDLESFYWLLVFIVLRHVQHQHRDGSSACAKLFDHWTMRGAANFKSGWLTNDGNLPISGHLPLQTLMEELRDLFLRAANFRINVPEIVTHDDFLDAINRALSKPGWPENDAALPYTGPRIKDPRGIDSATASEARPSSGTKRSRSSALGDSEGGSRLSGKKGKGKSAAT